MGNFPQSVIEKVAGLFSSRDISPGPTTSDILAYFSALVDDKARELLFIEASSALDDGALPQLLSETLDRGLLVEICKDLILSTFFNNGLEHPYVSDSAVFIFESPEMLHALGLEHAMQAYWCNHYEETSTNLQEDIVDRYEDIRDECLEKARLCRSQEPLRNIEKISSFFGEDSTISQFIEMNYSDAQLYLTPLTSGSIYLGALMTFHSGDQIHGSRVGADLALIGSALSLGFKRIVDVSRTLPKL